MTRHHEHSDDPDRYPFADDDPVGLDILEGAPSEVTGRTVMRFTRQHLGVVLVAAVVAIGLAASYAMRSRSQVVDNAVPARAPVTARSSAAEPALGASTTTGGGQAAAPLTASTSPATIVVHVLGGVRRPGVVRLPEGARVADAIRACGGLSAQGNPGDLNLAAHLDDGEQILVGTRGAPGGEVRVGAAGSAGGGNPTGPASANSSGGASGPTTTLDLNTATVEQLDGLPGVGPVTAQKILDWRTQHGHFTQVAELQEVDGIGPKTYARLAPLLHV